MKSNLSCIIFFLLFTCNKIFGQHLKLTTDKHIQFAEALLLKYPDEFAISSSIKEFDVEKIKEIGQKHLSEFDAAEKALFYELLNQYDHKKLSFEKEENVEVKDGQFISYNENEEKEEVYKSRQPLLKYFYKSPYHFLSIDRENFSVRANTIVSFSVGNANNYNGDVYKNTRGLDVSGYIDNKVYFHTKILETQEGFLPHTQQLIDSFSTIPQNGFYKPYKSGVLKNLNGYDFLNAQAYVGVPISKSVAVELGHGRHNIGNGVRSLFLSDFSNNYFFMKFNTHVWKLHYQNLFAELNPISANEVTNDELLPKKYMANHYLSIKPFKRLEVGLFESIIFSRKDQFEFQYLNPIILYRFVEQFLGSSDNALLGINAHYIIGNKSMVYGQIILDEFNLELFKQDGWFGNKHGFQLGFKTNDVLKVSGLNLQAEYNTVRPYTYSHNRPSGDPRSVSSYTHYNLPLAHPLGSNFKEGVLRVSYLPASKFNAEINAGIMAIGRDKEGKNFGGNVLKNTNTLFQIFGNETLQGERNDILFLRMHASYEILRNYKVFINPMYRKSRSANAAYNYSNVYIGGGININFDIDRNIY